VKIYEMAHSPFCIPIVQALRACRVEFTRQEIPNWDRREIIELTNGAYYEVPVLVADGEVVFETSGQSQDVARFVDLRYAGGALFPSHLDGVQTIMLRHIESDLEALTFKLVDIHYIPSVQGVGERGMITRHKERKFGRGCVDAWRREAVQIREEADTLLDQFEHTLRHQHYLFGEEPVYSDFALGGILGNLTFRGWNALDLNRHAALAAWWARLNSFHFQQRA
jgi:glutathione S-transferase